MRGRITAVPLAHPPEASLLRHASLAAAFLLAACSGSSPTNSTGTDNNLISTSQTDIQGADAGTASSSGTSTGSSGSTGSTGSAGGTGSTGSTTPPTTCLASAMSSFLSAPGLVVGADMTDTVAQSAPFDLRAQYISGGVGDKSSVCTSCGSCTSAGQSCASGGCGWWGCWQNTALAPGQFVRDFITRSQTNGDVPVFTYYELLQSSGASEGAGEVNAANNATLMARYFSDWRFFLQTIGSSHALINLEPDFWGYAEQLTSNPHSLAAVVSSAGADCAGLEQSISGMAQCMVHMARSYAPNARIGFNAAPWATNLDVYGNTDPSFDVTAEAKKEAAFLLALGAAQTDFVTLDVSDRDAGYDQANGAQNAFWDATNQTLPNFTQAFRWATALTEALGLPALWWQVPIGNMTLPNVSTQWRDNRLDYFFDHPDEVVQTHAFGVVYGAGQSDQTNPTTDNGHLMARMRTYATAGETSVCQ